MSDLYLLLGAGKQESRGLGPHSGWINSGGGALAMGCGGDDFSF